MTILTAATPDRRTVARLDETRAASGHGHPRALNFWSGWWRRDIHKKPHSGRDALAGDNGASSRLDTRREDMMAAPGQTDQPTTASTASTATQPVLVRAYSGSTSRQSTRATSKARMAQGRGTGSTTPSTAVDEDAKLPSIDDFKFTNLLLAKPSPDISHAIDAIAEICARSRLSLADEYGAHLPPFSHTLPPMPRTRGQMQGQREVMRLGLGKLERTLTTVPETSSNSECSSPSTSSGKSGHSAYGALTKVLRRSGSSITKSGGEERDGKGDIAGHQVAVLWQGRENGTQTLVMRIASPKASPETATTENKTSGAFVPSMQHAKSQPEGPTRSNSWFGRGSVDAARSAEARLKDLLRTPAPG